MTLELEINEATRRYLPREVWKFATPVRRVELRSSSGHVALSVIGQLVPARIGGIKGHAYSLVFRPEFSELDANFIVRGRDRLKQVTYEEACEFFLEEEFGSEEFARLFRSICFRPWLSNDSEYRKLILFSSKVGMICRNYMGTYLPSSRHSSIGLSFFEMSNEQFNQWATSIYEDDSSELNFALKWRSRDLKEQYQDAFACNNGSWDDLRTIARIVLQVALGQEESLPNEEFVWTFTSRSEPMPIYSAKNRVLDKYPQFLLKWRAILVNHFQPKYLNDHGFIESTPLCIIDYFNKSQDNKITAFRLTYHEMIEAQLYLSDWLKANSIPEA